MKTRARFTLSVVFAVMAASARADDDALRNDKPRVAQVVTLARLAPQFCEGILADDGAIRILMDKAGIVDDDIRASGAFTADDAVVARSFAQSVVTDRDQTCSEIFSALGPGGGGLLRRKEIKPMT